MTCILTDEEIEEAIRSYSDGTLKSADRVIANAAARKALEMAADECDECREAIRELARGYA